MRRRVPGATSSPRPRHRRRQHPPMQTTRHPRPSRQHPPMQTTRHPRPSRQHPPMQTTRHPRPSRQHPPMQTTRHPRPSRPKHAPDSMPPPSPAHQHRPRRNATGSPSPSWPAARPGRAHRTHQHHPPNSHRYGHHQDEHPTRTPPTHPTLTHNNPHNPPTQPNQSKGAELAIGAGLLREGSLTTCGALGPRASDFPRWRHSTVRCWRAAFRFDTPVSSTCTTADDGRRAGRRSRLYVPQALVPLVA